MADTLIRTFHKGDKGPDVEAMKRALKKAGFKRFLVMNQRFGSAADRQLRLFQKSKGLSVDGVYGQKTHNALWKYVDDYGEVLFSKAPKASPEEKMYAELIMWCERVTRSNAPYVWGGSHGVPLANVDPDDGMDCSSSTSFVLQRAGLFGQKYAWVSGEFAMRYGRPGSGSLFTIYANNGHVFIRLHKGKYWRFDTSPQGDGGRGPELRRLPRFTRGFYARCLPGM